MKEVEKVVEKHLLFDPSTDFYGELIKYGAISIVDELIPINYNELIYDIKRFIKILPNSGQEEIKINFDKEVLIIIEKDNSLELHKMLRKDAEKRYNI